MQTLFEDLRYGLRMLRKSPGFTVVAVTVLALGIGATTGVFSLVEAVLFRPPPVPAADRVVAVYSSGANGTGYSATSYPDYEYFRDHTQMLSGAAAYLRIDVSWSMGRHPEMAGAEVVSDNYFSVLGITPVLGQPFTPQADRVRGASPVVIVSFGFWQHKLGSDPSAIGKTLVVNGHTFTIIGVAPRGFEGVNVGWGSQPDMWIPFAMLAEVEPESSDFPHSRELRWLLVIGRLKDGVTLKQAHAEAKVLADQLAAAYPTIDKGRTSLVLPAIWARFWPAYRAQAVHVLALWAVAAGVVLFIACSNVASLLLARASGRRKEISIRLASGATGGRIARQLLTESLLLSALGAGCGLLVALFIMKWLPRFRLPFPVAFDLRFDTRVLLFTIALSAVSAVLFGLGPAMEASQVDLSASLKDSGREPLAGKFRVRSLLVVFEVALTTIVLVGAGLLLFTLQRFEVSAPCFDHHHVLAVGVRLYTRGYSPSQEIQFRRQLFDRVVALPGVISASLTNELPLSSMYPRMHVYIAGREATTPQGGFEIQINAVAPRYFETLRIPLLRGRDFEVEDDADAPRVAIVNRSMADRFWPGEDAVGKRIRVAEEMSDYEIVGIVSDIKYHTLGDNSIPYLYFPEFQGHYPMPFIVVRTQGDPTSAVEGVRREVAILDPQVPLAPIETLDQQLEDSLSPPRLAAALISFLASLALILGAAGIYGMLAYTVAERTHEIGIRMALGAGRAEVVKLVVRQGMVLTVTGMGAGLLTALAVTRTLSSLLYGVRPMDPATFMAVPIVLICVALAACFIPARRATKVDPMVALRHQ
jgi:putative ABC transport system permease protein